MNPLPEPVFLTIFNPFTFEIGIALALMCFLILCSALMSGSEVAFFSITKSAQERIRIENNANQEKVLILLETPKKLLATILVANNFINVAIVAVSTYIMNHWVDTSSLTELASFLIQVVIVTFIILLFGEVMPKVYATKYNVKLATFMAPTLTVIKALVKPISYLLVSSSNIIDKRIKKRTEAISIDDLEYAMNITTNVGETKEEKRILEGIIKFGNTDAKQIMTPRTDVVAFETSESFPELLQKVIECKFSRIPIYEDSVDNIKGILYVKDLLDHLEDDTYNWQDHLREAQFISENKKLDDLLANFKAEKKHLAIVVDEYGGSSGIVTLEDVIEEIVGDITDEFDEEDLVYTKVDDSTYIFEGKTPLMDMYRVLEIDGDNFENEKGEADTIAGFCIEQAGKILLKNERVTFDDYNFIVEAADKRRLKQIKVVKPLDDDLEDSDN